MQAVTNNVFELNSLDHQNGIITADILINPASSVFEGHFPGQPVVPGACILQLVKDVLENALQTAVLLKKAVALKFITMLIPQNNPQAALSVSYKITNEDSVSVNASLTSGGVICFKFNGEFIKI